MEEIKGEIDVMRKTMHDEYTKQLNDERLKFDKEREHLMNKKEQDLMELENKLLESQRSMKAIYDRDYYNNLNNETNKNRIFDENSINNRSKNEKTNTIFNKLTQNVLNNNEDINPNLNSKFIIDNLEANENAASMSDNNQSHNLSQEMVRTPTNKDINKENINNSNLNKRDSQINSDNLKQMTDTNFVKDMRKSIMNQEGYTNNNFYNSEQESKFINKRYEQEGKYK
jgi:hypothetical protein